MKKELSLVFIFALCILAFSIASQAVKESADTASADCKYNSKFDSDGDYIMNKGADCGPDYHYDCNDGDKDVFKDCEPNSLWNRIVDWLRGAGESKPTNLISSNAVKTIIPGSDEAQQHIKRVSERITEIESGKAGSASAVNADYPDCSPVTICRSNSLQEVYCPFDFSECCDKYDDCRTIECATEDDVCIAEDVYTYEYDDSDYEEDACQGEYHDCYDGGTAVICKGPFDACDSSFDRCTCGTSESADSYGEQAEPDFNTEEPVDCPTGVFVCERQVITMSGDIADSTVTCKESFQRCSQTYGNCQCGDSSLIDFPVQYTGSTDGEYITPQSYECEFDGKTIPCYLMPSADCNEKSNSCNRGDDIWITCSGAFSYCNRTFEGRCLCGVESLGYGDIVTEAD